MIYKLICSWGSKKKKKDLKVPIRSKLTGITILVGTFGPNNVGNTRTCTQTDTHKNSKIVIIEFCFNICKTIYLFLMAKIDFQYSHYI